MGKGVGSFYSTRRLLPSGALAVGLTCDTVDSAIWFKNYSVCRLPSPCEVSLTHSSRDYDDRLSQFSRESGLSRELIDSPLRSAPGRRLKYFLKDLKRYGLARPDTAPFSSFMRSAKFLTRSNRVRRLKAVKCLIFFFWLMWFYVFILRL